VLLFTAPYLFVLPYATKRRSGRGTTQETSVSESEDAELQHKLIRDALLCLDKRERYIAEARLLADSDAGVTLAEIGRRLGVSRERVRQLEERAKAKLRAAVEQIASALGRGACESLTAA